MVHSASFVFRACEIIRLWLAFAQKTINTQMSFSSRKAFSSFLFTSPSVRELLFLADISCSSLCHCLKLLIYLFPSAVHSLVCRTLLPNSPLLSPLSLKHSSLSLSLYPNSCTLLLPPINTPSYLYWTSNRINFPRTAGPAPVRYSWSLSEHLCLTAYKWARTPCKQGRPAHRCAHRDSLHNHKRSVFVTFVTN